MRGLFVLGGRKESDLFGLEERTEKKDQGVEVLRQYNRVPIVCSVLFEFCESFLYFILLSSFGNYSVTMIYLSHK